jgi:hypothetical protein
MTSARARNEDQELEDRLRRSVETIGTGERRMKRSPVLGPQAEQTRRMAEQFSGTGARVGMVVAPMVAAFGLPFVWGLILYLVGTKIFKGTFDYMKAVEVVGLAGMIFCATARSIAEEIT